MNATACTLSLADGRRRFTVEIRTHEYRVFAQHGLRDFKAVYRRPHPRRGGPAVATLHRMFARPLHVPEGQVRTWRATRMETDDAANRAWASADPDAWDKPLPWRLTIASAASFGAVGPRLLAALEEDQRAAVSAQSEQAMRGASARRARWVESAERALVEAAYADDPRSVDLARELRAVANQSVLLAGVWTAQPRVVRATPAGLAPAHRAFIAGLGEAPNEHELALLRHLGVVNAG